jgi:20S proteasome alpha/beta subunit
MNFSEFLNIFLKGGVVLGADSRATAGALVMDKYCVKLHQLSANICCSGAGTAADCDHGLYHFNTLTFFFKLLKCYLHNYDY